MSNSSTQIITTFLQDAEAANDGVLQCLSANLSSYEEVLVPLAENVSWKEIVHEAREAEMLAYSPYLVQTLVDEALTVFQVCTALKKEHQGLKHQVSAVMESSTERSGSALKGLKKK